MNTAHTPLPTGVSTENLVTLQSHILQQEHRHPEATGTSSWILAALSIPA